MAITTIKRIHNLVPPDVHGAVTVTVQNAQRNRSFTPDFSFTRRDDRDVDWPIPWAWEESHFTIDRQHIDVQILGTPGRRFTIFQEDDNVFVTNGTFAGPRTRLGDINGDRRLVIFPDHLELIGMLDPLPTAAAAICTTFAAPYTPIVTGGSDVRASTAGSFTIENPMWFARFHSVSAGFGRRVQVPSGGVPIQIQSVWDLNPRMRANGVGYASAALTLRLEAHPESMATGALEPPFTREQLFWRQQIVLGFHQPAGQFFGITPVLSLNITQRHPTDFYVLRAFVRSDVGGFGWINAEASCFGRLVGFNVCRL